MLEELNDAVEAGQRTSLLFCSSTARVNMASIKLHDMTTFTATETCVL
jgi:hypothetical protein